MQIREEDRVHEFNRPCKIDIVGAHLIKSVLLCKYVSEYSCITQIFQEHRNVRIEYVHYSLYRHNHAISFPFDRQDC
jgi:hypothetical protein